MRRKLLVLDCGLLRCCVLSHPRVRGVSCKQPLAVAEQSLLVSLLAATTCGVPSRPRPRGGHAARSCSSSEQHLLRRGKACAPGRTLCLPVAPDRTGGAAGGGRGHRVPGAILGSRAPAVGFMAEPVLKRAFLLLVGGASSYSATFSCCSSGQARAGEGSLVSLCAKLTLARSCDEVAVGSSRQGCLFVRAPGIGIIPIPVGGIREGTREEKDFPRSPDPIIARAGSVAS